MEAIAKLKYTRISARKVKIVIESIRGKQVHEASALVRNTPKAASEPVEKLAKSAIANAEVNYGMKRDNLYIKEIYANQGPTAKRVRPAPQGRAYRVRKRTSHVTVVLAEKE